jgi:superfamily II DNA or RNA helicase
MPEAVLSIGNARASFRNLPPEVFRTLQYDLSYRAGDAGERASLQDDGSAKTYYWDGFQTLLRKGGWMPSGLVPRALRLLRKWQVALTVVDERKQPIEGVPRWSLPHSFELRSYQLEAVRAALEKGRGVIDSPPRTGKTCMIVDLIRQVADMTVVTSPTVQIAKQTYERCLELLGHGEGWSGSGDPSSDFYLLTGGPPKSRLDKIRASKALVFIGTADTAMAMSKSWWEKVACLIVDERHHQAAKTYRAMNDLAINAYWRWGFTGTNYRSDPSEMLLLEAMLSETVKRFTIAEMTAAGVLVPARVEFRIVEAQGRRIGSKGFEKAYTNAVVRYPHRNAMVVGAAAELMEQGRKVLVLVERIEHGERLQAMISGSVFVQGADGDRIREVTKRLDRGELQCVIGSPVVGEGLDIPSADGIVYAKGMKARVTHTQDVFRALTGDGKKRDAVIIDFADRHCEMMTDHAAERLRNYLAMGVRAEVVDKHRGGGYKEGQTGFGL